MPATFEFFSSRVKVRRSLRTTASLGFKRQPTENLRDRRTWDKICDLVSDMNILSMLPPVKKGGHGWPPLNKESLS